MKRLCSCLWLLVGMILAVTLASVGQTAPDMEQGMHPYGSYQGGDVDSVSLSNGNLILHIPLVSYPQRGKLSLSFSVTHSNKGWTVHEWTQNFQVYDQWQWLSHNGNMGAQPIWDQDLRVHDDFNDQYNVDVLTLVSADGPSHTLGALADGSGAYESLDATGYRSDNSGIVDRNGIHWSADLQNNTTVTDPNGNKITANATSGWTDSLGRTMSGQAVYTGRNQLVFIPGISISPPAQCPNGTASARQWDIPGPTGTSTIFFCYSNYNFSTNFSYQNYLEGSVSNAPMLHAVVLPDSTSWIFDYNAQGDLSQLTFPTGGTISYTWANGPVICYADPPSPPVSRWVQTRTVNDGSGNRTWTYSFNAPTRTMTVTDPDNNDTAHAFTGLSGTCSYFETQTQYYTGRVSGGTLLKTVSTAYGPTMPNPYDDYSANASNAINAVPITITTTWPNGKVSKIQEQYDSGTTFEVIEIPNDGPFPLIYGLVTNTQEFDFGQNMPSRQTVKSYLWQSNPTYQTSNFLNLVASSTTQDGSGNTCARTDYGYDNPARLFSSGVTQQHGTPPASVRGNVTSIGRWVSTGSNNNPCLAAGQGTEVYSYVNVYDTGLPYQAIDPRGNTTTYQYSSSFYGAYVTETDYPSTSSPNPASHIIHGNYNFNSGLLTSFTDQNSRVSTYSYDNMFRLTGANFPDTGWTTLRYASPTLLERQQNIDGSRITDTYVQFDGLGRETRRATASDEPTVWDEVDTCYNGRGLKAFVSYPYQNPSGFGGGIVCSGAGDRFTYDGLRRVTQITHSDGSAVVTSYGGASGGAAASVTDEGSGSGNIQRVSQVDGLGRLSSVCEVTSHTLAVGIAGSTTPAACGLDIAATGFVTTYQYDALGDLLTVSQGPLNQRSFGYDSLSRLVKATNPESGTTTYSYGGGSPCSGDMSSVCSRTDARGKVTTYSYDPLNRLRTKTYSDTTPGVAVNYDETSAHGVVLTNTTGRKSSESTGGSSPTGSVFSYDNMGRILNNSQCTPQNCLGTPFSVTYAYDFVGDQTSATNGAGVTLTHAYNRAQRLTGITSSLSDANHPATLLSGAHYNAFGMMTSAPLGNTLTEVRTATARGWLQSLNVNIPDANKNTASTANITVQGSEQSTVLPGTPGTGTVSITGENQCFCYYPRPSGLKLKEPLLTGPGHPVPACSQGQREECDSGNITVTVNGHGDSVHYAMHVANTFLVSTLAANINNDAGAFVTASANGSVLNLTAKTSGSNTNYSLVVSEQSDNPDFPPQGSFTVTRSGPNLTGGTDARTVYDTGFVRVTVNGTDAKSANYGQGSTASTVASALAAAFSGDGLVAASANGATVTLTSVAKGQNTNYSLAYYSQTNQGNYFAGPSFTDSGPAAMSGGTNGYDTIYGVGMGYAPDGDVTSGNDSVNGNWAYTYDDFNRLATANKTGQGCAYVYDRFGNRWQQNVTQGTCPSPQFTFDANNRINTGPYTYDAAGNMTGDGIHTYAYDAENRITTVDSGTTATYVYDAEGRRIRRTTGSGTVDIVYNFGGQVVSQFSSSGTWTRGEIFGGGRHVATYANGTGGTTLFAHADWIGTERMRTNLAGVSTESFVSLAFGDALNQTGSSPVHLTMKERDSESQLDYFGARYYSSSLGRFLGADPIQLKQNRLFDPQRLNLFSYCHNSPIICTDPDGRDGWDIVTGVGQGLMNFAVNSYSGLRAAAQHPSVIITGTIDSLKTAGHAYFTSEGRTQLASQFSSLTTKEKSSLLTEALAQGVAAAAVTKGIGAAAKTFSGSAGLSDSAIVVRGGVPTVEQLTKGAETISAEGKLSGISVNSGNGLSVEELSQGIPNNKVGVTTVGDVREIGGDVVPDATPDNPNHCVMCNVDPQQASDIFDVQKNPSKVTTVNPQ